MKTAGFEVRYTGHTFHALVMLAAICAAACGRSDSGGAGPQMAAIPAEYPAPSAAEAITKIKHIVIIMQENRSFDSYFGAFPRADGIPMKNDWPTVCVADPVS